MGLEIAFGKGRWMYWTILVAVLVAAGVILARRQSPEEVARKRLVWGDAALAAGEYEQAIAFYGTALEKDPTLYGAYFNLALAYEYVDEEKALAAWENYLEVAANEPAQREWLEEARAHRAHLKAAPAVARAAELHEAGEYEEARREYEAALAWEGDSLAVLRGAAANEAAAGEFAAAAQYYERALEFAPYSMNIRYELAQVYEELDPNKAAALYRELLEMSGTHTGITRNKLKRAQRRHLELRRRGYRDE
jgi:tetratricopeptide (TPR) repeat protein